MILSDQNCWRKVKIEIVYVKQEKDYDKVLLESWSKDWQKVACKLQQKLGFSLLDF